MSTRKAAIDAAIQAAKTDRIKSRLILGTSPTPATVEKLRAHAGAGPNAEITMCVFEVTLGNAVRYCCWAGGALVDGEPHLTLAGQGAVEALMRLPFVADHPDVSVVFQELKMGPTPLRDKVIASFNQSADIPSVICFVGDLAKELDGQMGITFNFNGYVDLADCVGLGRQRG